MKKFLSLLLTMVMAALPVYAEDASTAFVSITDESGALALSYQPIPLNDADGDGTLTINDALINAHAAHHPDGAAAYLSEPSQFGMSMVVLWGCGHGAFGYCVNDVSAMNPLDPVRPGDHVKAYAYTDLSGWSDLYSFFDCTAVAAEVNGEVALTLNANAFDENWSPIVLPVEGAILTINGETTESVTDAAGNAVLTFAQAGTYLISAVSESQVLVAPVCIVTVK